VTGTVEDEESKGSNKFAEKVVGVDVNIQLHTPFAEIIEEKGHYEQVVHHHHKGMYVLVVYYDPHQQ